MGQSQPNCDSQQPNQVAGRWQAKRHKKPCESNPWLQRRTPARHDWCLRPPSTALQNLDRCSTWNRWYSRWHKARSKPAQPHQGLRRPQGAAGHSGKRSRRRCNAGRGGRGKTRKSRLLHEGIRRACAYQCKGVSCSMTGGIAAPWTREHGGKRTPSSSGRRSSPCGSPSPSKGMAVNHSQATAAGENLGRCARMGRTATHAGCGEDTTPS
mmetsp:Transcript_97830/g.224324  ORF Transcript_97830/g.224324 Transcript_97830/m.224324 type:complete len:211 (+) Transcript_97830:476-1108(+)